MLNVSIDLGVHGRDASPRPPVEVYLRVIEEPLVRLVSVDLGASADIANLAEVFDFAKDYLAFLIGTGNQQDSGMGHGVTFKGVYRYRSNHNQNPTAAVWSGDCG